MTAGKFVSYCRVSTAKQGVSGLGLEAQKSAILQFLNGGTWELIGEFVEVESGKVDNRPELLKALKRCKLTGATLLVAKLDRLSRDMAFICSLEKAGVEFTVCDFPSANKFTIHIFAALAQYERELISQRTTAALAAKKARGEKIGSPQNLTPAAMKKGAKSASKARIVKADRFALEVVPLIQDCLDNGLSLNKTAQHLNERHILTPTGKAGMWTAQAVKNIINRIREGK
jgi:DNA invertase Pin-like site-specific DNA recombinase